MNTLLPADYFTPQEKQRLLFLCRSIARDTTPAIDIKEYRNRLQHLVEIGCFARDDFGYNGLLRQLEVAYIVLREFNLSSVSLSAALFYRSIYKGYYTTQEVASFTPTGTVDLIEKMRKTAQIYMRRSSVEESLFRELLLSVAEDARVLLLIIADRLYRMRTAKEYLPPEKRSEQAEEVNRYFIPITHKIGLYRVKGELEDLYLKYTNPDAFYTIKNKLGETKREREAYLNQVVQALKRCIDAGAKRWRYEIKARTKSISSIHNKMQNKGVAFDSIFDLTALRIIIEAPRNQEKEACWYYYSLITASFTPDISRLRDWITHPKDNGYESLQITIEAPGDRFVEVQIRTQRMDEVAERGVAAHWRYKGVHSEGSLDQSLTSVRKMLEHTDGAPLSNERFSLQKPSDIFVFTPRGELKKLPHNATVLDFAFAIHSNVGATATAALVNGKNASLRTTLHNGDTVSITTQKNQFPREDWLQIVVTPMAKHKIRQKLRERNEKALPEVRAMLERRFRNRKLPWDESLFNQLIRSKGYNAINLFLRDIAEEKIEVAHFLEDYEQLYVTQHLEQEKNPTEAELTVPLTYEAVSLREERGDPTVAGKGEGTVMIVDSTLNGVDYDLAQCCQPQYGDAIIAYPSRDGIKIHRRSCPNVAYFREHNPEKILSAEWYGLAKTHPKAHIYVEALYHTELLSKLVSLVKNSTSVTLLSYNIQPHGELITAEFTVQAPENLINALRNQLATLSGVHEVRLRI